MPDTKISALTAVTTPLGGDEFAVNQGGTSKKETVTQIAAAIFLFDDVKWQNATDSVTGFQILDNDGGVPVFNVDTVSERVGIGTAAPAELLHMSGSSPFLLIKGTSAGGFAGIRLYDSGGAGWTIQSNGADALDFSLAGVGTQGIITAAGSWGIGPSNTSPTGTLTVLDARSSTGDTDFVVKAGAGQAAPLQSWKDASDGLLASIGPTGAASAQPGGSIPVTKTYTVAAAVLTTASATEDEVLFSLPARSKILSVSVKHTLAFSGGSLSAMTVSVGDSSSTTFYTSAFNIFAAVSDTNFQDTDMYKSSTYAARDVLARFTSTSDTMDNVTAGVVEITIQWVTLPA